MNKIFTGADKAHELGFPTYQDMVVELAKIRKKKWNGNYCKSSVYARIDFARWIADCECGAANYVDPETPNFYYCYTCGNATTNGDARPVIFPDNKEDIEKELLKRTTTTKLGLMGTNGALNSIGVISRSWSPGETIEALKIQRELSEHK